MVREINGTNGMGYVKTIEDKLNVRYNNINSSEENRRSAVTSIAAISRGKDKSNNPDKRYQHLLKEAAPNISFYDLENMNYNKLEHVAGRPLEYCPVVLGYKREFDMVYLIDLDNNTIIDKVHELKFMNDIVKFSHMTYDKIYTNLRALYNAGIEYNKIPYNKEINDYFICEVKAPYFVFAQMRTHGLLSQVAVSERVVDSEELWFPEDIFDRINKNDKALWYLIPKLSAMYDKETITSQLDLAIKEKSLSRLIHIFKTLPIDTVQQLLKDLGYKKEIYQRWYNHMLYKTWIIGGYLNNPYQWGHFLLEREAYDNLLKSWVQEQTKDTAKTIRRLILDYLLERSKNDVQ